MPNQLVMTEKQINQLKERIKINNQFPGPLMPTLYDAQEIFGCVNLDVQKLISQELGISIAKINGVVAFYPHFTNEPIGKNIIKVCMGTNCYAHGSSKILDKCCQELHLNPGETSSNQIYTLNATKCMGGCHHGPLIEVNGQIHTHATVNLIDQIIEEIEDE